MNNVAKSNVPYVIPRSKFIHQLFIGAGKEERIWVAHFEGTFKDPRGGSAQGSYLALHSAEDAKAYDALSNKMNHFTSTATFSLDGRGARKRSLFKGLHFIMLDDVEDVDSLPLAPSYVLETSTGSHQVGFLLDEPLRDSDRADRLAKSLQHLGYADTNGNNAVRVVRVNRSINGKPERNNFEVKLRLWQPDLRYTIEALEQHFLVPSDGDKQPAARVADLTLQTLLTAPAELATKTLRDWLPVFAERLARDPDYKLGLTGSPWREGGGSDSCFLRLTTSNVPCVVDSKTKITHHLRATDESEARYLVTGEVQFEPKDWVFLLETGKFFNLRNGSEVPKDAFNTAFNQMVPLSARRNNRVLSASEYVIESATSISPNDKMYWPAAGRSRFEHQGKLFVNSYLPNLVPPADPNWETRKEWRLVRDHITTLLPDPTDHEQLILWMAHNVQFPGQKILWAPAIKGVEGDGKSALGAVLQATLGQSNVNQANPDEIHSGFTSWAANACVVTLEELRISGGNRKQVMDRLKPFITNPTVRVVYKGRDGINVVNTANYIAFTNHEDALLLNDNDRRWAVMFTQFKTREQLTQTLNATYFDRLFDAIHNAPEVIKGWLASIDLSDFNPNKAPLMTTGKQQMINNSHTNTAQVILEAISNLSPEEEEPEILITSEINTEVFTEYNQKIQPNSMKAGLEELGYSYVARVKYRGVKESVYLKLGTYTNLMMQFKDDQKGLYAHLRRMLDERA